MTPEELSQAAFAAFNRGAWAEAESLFRALQGVVPDWLPCRYGLGMTLFQRGDYAGAAPLLRDAWAGGIGLPESWTYHCHALAMLEQEAELAAALAFPADPLVKSDLVFQIFNNRLAHGRGGTVLPLFDRLPEEPALRMGAAFWAGIACADRDPEATYDYFRTALDQAALLRADGTESPLVASHIAAGAGIEPDVFVFAATPESIAPPTVTWLDPPSVADSEFGVFFAAADGAYAEEFAVDCAASLGALGPGRTLHLHIVNPSPNLAALITTIRDAAPELALRVSIEQAPGGDAVYYACSRFLLLPRLIDRYGTAVTVIDIDCLFQPAAAQLPALGGGADLALFRLDTVFPWLKHPAAMVIVADNTGGREFAAILCSYLGRKLNRARNWTLDQAGLFCVVGALRRHRPAITIAELNAANALTLDDLVRSQGSFAAKRALRLRTIRD